MGYAAIGSVSLHPACIDPPVVNMTISTAPRCTSSLCQPGPKEHAFADDRGTSSARRIVLRRVIGVPAACRIVLRRPVDHCSFRQGRSWPNEDRSWLREDRSSSRDECSSSKEGCSSLRKHRSSLAKDCSLLFDRSLLISARPVLAERGSFFVAGASDLAAGGTPLQ